MLGQNQSGGWRGFPTLAGESDVWVTAFVVAHLRELAPRSARLFDARAFLAARQWPHSGWSYGGTVPPDADSTAWALIALQRTRQLTWAARRDAVAFLASHQREGGTATYRDDGAIARYIGTRTESLSGWTSPHPDVTAAALLAGVPPAGSDAALTTLSALVARQTGAGFWEAYWWRGPLYTSALVLRAVEQAGFRLPGTSARRLMAALEREQLPGGAYALGASLEPDAFTTALALECYARLAYLGGAERREAAFDALVALQQDAGGWPGGFTMRIPAPGVVDPRHVSGWARGTGGGNSYVLDTNGVFATTLSCSALATCRQVARDRASSHGQELAIAGPALLDEDTVVVSNRC